MTEKIPKHFTLRRIGWFVADNWVSISAVVLIIAIVWALIYAVVRSALEI